MPAYRVPQITSSFASGSVSDNRVVLACGYIARLHNITGWKTLRVGMRVQTETGYGENITSRDQFPISIGMGLCNFVNALTGSPGQPYVKNAIYVVATSQSPTYTAATATTIENWNHGVNNTVPFNEINNSASYFAPSFVTNIYWGATASGSTRRMYFVDFISGSGTFTVKMFYCNISNTGSEPTEADFRVQMSASIPSFVNHNYAGPNTLPVSMSESSGSLNAAFIYYNWMYPKLYISDFAVVKIE